MVLSSVERFGVWPFIVVLAVAVFISGKLAFAPVLMSSVLVGSIDDMGSTWGTKVLKEVESTGMCVAGEGASLPPSAHVDKHTFLANSFRAMLEAGVFSQIDFSVQGCDCSISLVAGAFDEAGARTDDRLSMLIGDDGLSPEGQLIAAIHMLMSGQLAGHVVIGPKETFVGFAPTFSTGNAKARQEIHRLQGDDPRTFGSTSVVRDVGPSHVIEMRLVEDVSNAAAFLALILRLTSGLAVALGVYALFTVMRSDRATAQAGVMTARQARYLAVHDPLTGLFNRVGLSARSDILLAVARETHQRAALIQFDADRFKDINDFYGHDVGDKVLRQMADLLRRSFPEAAIATRLGGDEFAVLVGEWMLSDPLEEFLANLPTTHTISPSESNGAFSIESTFSGGYAVYPDDGQDLAELMKSADLALYAVKRGERNAVGPYSTDLGRAFERRLWEIDGVRDAIEAGQIVPYYQPIINARTREIEGFESLARWNHPELGVLTPNRFQNALFDPSTSTQLTSTILDAITRDVARWQARGYHFSVGLNVGEADLRRPDLIEEITTTIEKYDLRTGAIAIEVTESAANQFNLDELKIPLTQAREAGLFVALDDFGTAGSSISILKELPCTAMKIDKSFVAGMTREPQDLNIVRALTSLAHDLGLKTIAEGVETEEQAMLLRELGVDLLQGFLISAPMTAEDVDRLLRTRPVARVVQASAA